MTAELQDYLLAGLRCPDTKPRVFFLMPEATITHEGQTITVDLSAITLPEGWGTYSPDQPPKGYVTQAAMNAEVERAREQATKGLLKPVQILEDDNLFQRAAKQRGYEFDDDGKIAGSARLNAERVQAIKDEVRREELEPVVKERDTFKAEAERERQGSLMRDLMQAASNAGLKPAYLKNPFGSGPSPYIADLAKRAEWDDERKVHYFRDGDNILYAEKSENGHPYAGPDRFFEILRKRDQDGLYFEDRRQAGSNFVNNGQPGSNQVTRQQFEAMSPHARMEHAKKGGKIVD